MPNDNFNTSLHSFMADTKFMMDYSRWIDDNERFETWDESVDRVMSMHEEKLSGMGVKLEGRLRELFEQARTDYKNRMFLGAQRALQFGGKQILKHEAKIYNCATSYVDRVRFFSEAMYLLLCGCGTGFSVQKHHINKLPKAQQPTKSDTVTFVVEDSIEGWADAVDTIMASYMVEESPYFGRTIHFDLSEIRPKGAMISGGFIAPGPDGLRETLEDIRKLLTNATKAGARQLRSIEIYDTVMYIARAVLSGGVRRAATICVFSKDDEDMMKAKTGTWYDDHPHRSYSNNSAMLVRDDLSYEEYMRIKESVLEFGEPGSVLSDSDQIMFNPCVEIGMIPELLTKWELMKGGLVSYADLKPESNSGWQFCNLCDVNAPAIKDRLHFLRVVTSATVLGTIQAAYTSFRYLTEASRKITELDALIGVGITGWMANYELLFDAELLQEAAELVKTVNAEVAALIGINPAARTTTVKPSGNSSVLLSVDKVVPSGCHAEHSPYYFRTITVAKTQKVYELFMKHNPKMVEDRIKDPGSAIITFPIVAVPTSRFKRDKMGVEQLKDVKFIFENWVKPGTREERSRIPGVTHNVSNTISVADWDETFDYIYKNRNSFAGVSMMGEFGDRSFPQAPYCGVYPADELVEMYGDAAIMASGLVVDGLDAFDGDLWSAVRTARGFGLELDPHAHEDLKRRDWVRRFEQFAHRHADGDLQKIDNLVKDVYNLHRWHEIIREFKPINYVEEMTRPEYIVAGSDAGAACSGNVCEIL